MVVRRTSREVSLAERRGPRRIRQRCSGCIMPYKDVIAIITISKSSHEDANNVRLNGKEERTR